MRRIAIVNQKGGVGKTTTTVNLGAALARAGRRVVVVDLDPQGNLSTSLGVELAEGEPSSYSVLSGELGFGDCLVGTSTDGLRLVPTNIDLSGAELELTALDRREFRLAEAVDAWERDSLAREGIAPAEYVLFDCPPSLGLLSLNALVAAREVFLALQTEFLALQGMTRVLDVVGRIREHLNPVLSVTGIVPCLYDSRLRLAREVLGELRQYFPAQCFRRPISNNVKLAEAPSFGRTIFEYAPDSAGARDYTDLAEEVLAQERRSNEGAEQVHVLKPEAPSRTESSPPPSAGSQTEEEAHSGARED
jgi:chromosome partitioning protein